MKLKILSLSVSFILMSIFVFATGDGRWTIEFTTGYNLGMNSTITGTNDSYGNFGMLQSSEVIRGSYGRGVPVSIGGLYNIGDCSKVGLRINNVFGSEFTVHEYVEPTQTGETVAKTNVLLINPFFETKLFDLSDKVSVVTNLGVIFNAGGTIEETETASGTNFGGAFTAKQVMETKLDMHMGCTGGVNLNLGLTDRINVLAGFNGQIIRPIGKESEITEQTFNGVDNLQFQMPYDIKTNYVDKLDSGSNNSQYNPLTDFGSAKDELQMHHDLNSWTVNVGVRYNF